MYDVGARAYLSRCVADAFLAGVWNERALVDRAGRALDRRPRWVRPVAREVLAAYRRPPADRPRELARFIELSLRDRPPDANDPAPPAGPPLAGAAVSDGTKAQACAEDRVSRGARDLSWCGRRAPRVAVGRAGLSAR